MRLKGERYTKYYIPNTTYHIYTYTIRTPSSVFLLFFSFQTKLVSYLFSPCIGLGAASVVLVFDSLKGKIPVSPSLYCPSSEQNQRYSSPRRAQTCVQRRWATSTCCQSVDRSPADIAGLAQLSEGGSNRTFLITMRDGFQMVARIPYLVTVPKNYAVASEVATMNLLRSSGLPIPKGYRYSPEPDNLLDYLRYQHDHQQ